MLTVIGGTYHEYCEEPISHELYGSGLRAAAALSRVIQVDFKSCVGRQDVALANAYCSSFNIQSSFEKIDKTISFYYYHPLSRPDFYPHPETRFKLSEVSGENILYYGMIEAEVEVSGRFVVYDPQNGVSFSKTNSITEHLAIVLNKKEALLLASLGSNVSLVDAGREIMSMERAEVVVIKNGSYGALVIEKSAVYQIPVYETSSVWPIGSGDIFSAVFAWKWAVEKSSAYESAQIASKYTAQYCATQLLPITRNLPQLSPLPIPTEARKVYLAGPFFTISERWLVNEIRNILIDFGNIVFSPYHDVGLLSDPNSVKDIVTQDLNAIHDSDVIFAIGSGMDAGTIFEIGYAKALGKKVIVFGENINVEDLTMLSGSNCIITNDLSTAIYKASW